MADLIVIGVILLIFYIYFVYVTFHDNVLDVIVELDEKTHQIERIIVSESKIDFD